MKNVLAIAGKEFRATFRTPIAYVIIALFLAVTGWLFFYFYPFFERREASMRAFFGTLPFVFLLFVPALTMRLWAEERKSGTIETLLTMPVEIWQVVTGKFLGVLGLLVVLLALTFPIPLALFYLGDPDPGAIIGGYVGAFLLGAAYAAVGLFASGITENQIIAFLVAVVLGFFLYVLGYSGLLDLFPGLAELFQRLSMSYHFQGLSRGVIDTRDVLYYLSVVVFFLVLNARLLQVRRFERVLNVILTAGILMTLNTIALGLFARVDLTENNLYTLHPNTQALLQRVEDDLDITVYLPPASEMPDRLATVPRDIRDLLDEFGVHANEHVRIHILDVSRPEVRREAEAAGVRRTSAVERSSEELSARFIYLGALVSYGDRSELIPAITRARSLEYDLALAIAKVTREFQPVVAFNIKRALPDDLPPEIRADIETRDPLRQRHDLDRDYKLVRSALEKQFKVQTIDLHKAVDEDIDCLVLANMDALDEVARFYVDQYLMRGGHVVLLVDGMYVDRQGRATPRPPANDDWLATYGVTVGKDIVFDDGSCVTAPARIDATGKPVMRKFPWLVRVLPENMDPTHPLTRNLEELLLSMPASVVIDPPEGVQASMLASTTEKAWDREESFHFRSSSVAVPEGELHSYDLIAVLSGLFPSHFAEGAPAELYQRKERPEGPASGGDSETDHSPGKEGAGSSSQASSGGPPDARTEDGASVIRIPDSIAGEQDLEGEPSGPPPLPVSVLDHGEAPGVLLVVPSSEFIAVSRPTSGVLFFQNAVEWLAIGDELMGIRSRKVQGRRFEEVGEVERAAIQLGGIALVPLLVLVLGFSFYFYQKGGARREVKL